MGRDTGHRSRTVRQLVTLSSVRKESMRNTLAYLSLFSFSLRPKPTDWNGMDTVKVGVPTSINTMEKSSKGLAQRHVSYMILACPVDNINHHMRRRTDGIPVATVLISLRTRELVFAFLCSWTVDNKNCSVNRKHHITRALLTTPMNMNIHALCLNSKTLEK